MSPHQSLIAPIGVGLWLGNHRSLVWPGLGFLAAIYGALSEDKLAAFLMGLIPSILDFLILYSFPTFGYLSVYSDNAQTVWGLLTFIAIGFGLGLIGLPGCFYGDFKRENDWAKSARLFLLLLISGVFVSVFII